ncbi:MAG TPA: DUF4416 family protein [Pirellulales bacterium]|jgi:hypothetical protein|nr:DUF4416 family protein [Pirellulales bacterium]
MGQANQAAPVLSILAAFSRHEQALAWARETAEAHWGPMALASPAFEFTETEYYTTTMGAGLKKQFFAFEQLIDPARLVDFKLQSNQWEAQYAALEKHAELRPLNLDPGYITLAKLVLASTKDHSHRIYLGRGIFAEITLSFRSGGWQPSEWTYPDYRRADFQRFFDDCRAYLKGIGGKR